MPWRHYTVYGLLVLAAAGVAGSLTGAAPAAVWGAALLAAAVAVVLLEDFRRRLTEPLRDAAEAVRRLGRGEFTHKLYAGGQPALADLARTCNAATDALADRFARLEDDRRQLRAVLSGMVEGVVALDAKQRVLYANGRAARLLDSHPPRAVGRRFWEVVRHRRLQDVVKT